MNTLGKGKTFNQGDFTYKILSDATAKVKTVVVQKVRVKKATCTIPATVTYQKITYQVVEIAKKASVSNKKLKTLIIGKNVKKIGASAFEKCKKLKKIKVKSKILTSKSIGKKAFKKVAKKCKISAVKKKIVSYIKKRMK